MDLSNAPSDEQIIAIIESEQRKRSKELTEIALRGQREEIIDSCKTLRGFLKEAWHVLEPTTKFVPNWHTDALCDHLQAMTYAEFTRFLANVPPGSSKSMICSVMWNAWEWGPMNLASNRFLSTSFSDDNVSRDTRKTRDLVMSDWFQTLWPHVKMLKTGETAFSNTSMGTRQGSAFGSLTGKRGDRFVIDDPHSTETAESETERDTTTRKFREGAINRLNDQTTSLMVVIMQRLHEKDISGVIMDYGMQFEHLMLPMRFEPDRKCYTCIGFEDPRTQEGELLDPVRFPEAAVDQLESDMGSYAFAGQYQQSPTPREGGMFQRADFKKLSAVPVGTVWCRGWDFAATEVSQTNQAPAYTAGVLVGRTPAKNYIIGDSTRLRGSAGAVETLVLDTAEQDGRSVKGSIPQDPGQAGKAQAQYYIKQLAGYNYISSPETGDKVTRAGPLSAQCEAGNVYILSGDWNETFLDEICTFPGSKFKDQVDAATRAFNEVALATATKTKTVSLPL